MANPPKPVIENLPEPVKKPVLAVTVTFQRFLAWEAAGGIVLLVATALALIAANSPLREAFADFWKIKMTVGVGDFEIDKGLYLWINDGLMAIFFFLIGLEIKRECLIGELKSPRQALAPIFGAVGGMAGPALIFAAIAWNDKEAIGGWGVPMATDIAFAIGLMALLGSRVPIGLKVFLTALAIVDDLGAVAVIAIFYTESINMTALGTGGGLLIAAFALNKLGVRMTFPYAIIAVAMWVAVLKSGVHATVAGVAMAMAIPATGSKGETGEHDSMLIRLEHAIAPWSAFIIMPIFALANAGVTFSGEAIASITKPVSLGIALGLFFGNQIGIMFMTLLLEKTGFGQRPEGVTLRQLHGASLLAGVGFTMSLFIASLAFESEMLENAKMGVLLGSFVSGVAGLIALYTAAKPAVQAPGSAGG